MDGDKLIVLTEEAYKKLSRLWVDTEDLLRSLSKFNDHRQQVFPLQIPHTNIMVKVTGAKGSAFTSLDGLYPGKHVFRSNTHDPSKTVGTGDPKNPPKWTEGASVWIEGVSGVDLIKSESLDPIVYAGNVVGEYQGKPLVVVGGSSGVALAIGKMYTQLTYQGDAQMDIWASTDGVATETQTTDPAITVYDWLLKTGQTVDVGVKVIAAKINHRWYVIAAQCA